MKIMPMNTARMYHSLASLNGKVYATGGTDGDIRVLNTVECYNSKTDKWLFVKPMSEARLAASTGVINGKLYTAGGYGENIRRVHSCCVHWHNFHPCTSLDNKDKSISGRYWRFDFQSRIITSC
jgi:N-acetylneuraminic acid mutarotase